jgi:hypothetical protein
MIVNDELGRMWKQASKRCHFETLTQNEAGVTQLKYEICQSVYFPLGRESNLGPPKYAARLLSPKP